MNYVIQDMVFISLVVMGFMGCFQGLRILVRALDKYRKKKSPIKSSSPVLEIKGRMRQR